MWPDNLFKKDDIDEDNLHRVITRKKSSASFRRKTSEPSLITQSSDTPSDQRPREEKSAPYRHARYKLQLRERGIFMDKHGKDITDKSKCLCQKLLETPQTLPQDSLFKDELFEETCDKIHNCNESRVIRDIAPLIVPSAGILATRGTKHLRILTETINEDRSSSVLLLGPHPQPDYSWVQARIIQPGSAAKTLALDWRIRQSIPIRCNVRHVSSIFYCRSEMWSGSTRYF